MDSHLEQEYDSRQNGDFEELEDAEVDQDDPAYDDDPQCVCGVYRSEHARMGCGNFQTEKDWEFEKEFIYSLNDGEFDRIYHPYE